MIVLCAVTSGDYLSGHGRRTAASRSRSSRGQLDGNVLIQAGAAGVLPTDLQSLRSWVRKSDRLQRFRPSNTALWDRIDSRFGHFAGVVPK